MNTDYRILYVDDEPGNRLVFDQTFGERFFIRVVSSGDEALEALAKQSFAVLITDQRMPMMSGNELLTRAKELYPNVIRIIITAYDDVDPILLALNEGLVARYIVKPWNRSELEEVLAWALEAYNLGQQDSAIQARLLKTERLVTIGTMGSALVHDIRQPLSFIKTNAEYLLELGASLETLPRILDEFDERMPETDLKNLRLLSTDLPTISEEISQGCKLLIGLVEDMARLLRPSLVASETDARTDPKSVIRWVLSACRQPALAVQSELYYDGPNHLASVRMSFAELAQILINLATNAVQAVESGSAKRRVVFTALEEQDSVSVTIEDNGPGMSPEILAKAGTLFYTTRATGTGLGIAQCRRLIGRAGGKLDIQSAEGCGTQVTVTLPR